MKLRNFCILLSFAFFVMFLSACGLGFSPINSPDPVITPDIEPEPEPITVQLNASEAYEGFVINYPSGLVKETFKTAFRYYIPYNGTGTYYGPPFVCTGNAYSIAAIRSFLSFSMDSILPASGQTLVIKRAELKLYQGYTTPMNPFVSGDLTRELIVQVVKYNEFDVQDFYLDGADCGTIAAESKDTFSEYTLDVADTINEQYDFHNGENMVQFRLKFNIEDASVSDGTNPYVAFANTYWGFVATAATHEFEPILNSPYIPVLEIDYYYK